MRAWMRSEVHLLSDGETTTREQLVCLHAISGCYWHRRWRPSEPNPQNTNIQNAASLLTALNCDFQTVRLSSNDTCERPTTRCNPTT